MGIYVYTTLEQTRIVVNDGTSSRPFGQHVVEVSFDDGDVLYSSAKNRRVSALHVVSEIIG